MRFGWFPGFRSLPGFPLGRGQHGLLFEQGPDAVEPDPGRGMKPTEAAHASVTTRQDVLEEAASQFERGEG